MQTNIELLFCRSCKTDTPVSDFTPFQQTARYPRCRPCVSKKSNDWYIRNEDRRKAIARTYRSKHHAREVERVKTWRKANPAKSRAASKRCGAALKERVFSYYGKLCACCGESQQWFLCIDHTNNNGNSHRRALNLKSGNQFYLWLERSNFPSGFQTLCHNCNFGKHLNGGVCPHQDIPMKHPDQDHADEVHEIHHPVGHGLLDTRRDLHNRSPHAMNTPIVGSQTPMDPTQGPQYA